MNYTRPEWEISIEDKEHYRQAAIETGIARALNLGVAQERYELKMRDVRPEDVGLTSWATTPDGIWIDHRVALGTIIVIFKALQLSAKPNISRLEFYQGIGQGFCVGTHELECCYAGLPILERLQLALLDPDSRRVLDRLVGRDEASLHPNIGSRMEAWFTEPHMFDPATTIIVKVKGNGTGGDYIVLLGVVIERAVVTII